MTRDEVVGLALHAPEEAQPDLPETVEPGGGEGEAVNTVVRDMTDDVDVEVHNAVDRAADAESDVDVPPEHAAPEGKDDSPDAAEPHVDVPTTADEPVASDSVDELDPDAAEPDDDHRTITSSATAESATDPATAEPLVDPTPAAAAPAASPAPAALGDTRLDASRPAPRPRPAPAYEEITTTYVVQDGPTEMSSSELRIDFGAHLEANYQRLVAQMYAITLSPDQAHSVVQDAYSRAWRNWAVIGRSADPTGWVRRVAVRTTMRSWRHVLARFGLVRSAPPVADGLDERTSALLTALRELPAPERRSVVLFHMAGLSQGEIAAVEQVSPNTISTRLDRARRVVMGDTSDLLTGVIELSGVVLDDDRGYVDEMSMPRPAPEDRYVDDRWERTDAWTGGPDGSWLVAEAPPWDAAVPEEWPRSGRGSREDSATTTSATTTSAMTAADRVVDGIDDRPRNDSEDKR